MPEFKIMTSYGEGGIFGYGIRHCQEPAGAMCQVGNRVCPRRENLNLSPSERCTEKHFFSAVRHGVNNAQKMVLDKLAELNPKGASATGKRRPFAIKTEEEQARDIQFREQLSRLMEAAKAMNIPELSHYMGIDEAEVGTVLSERAIPERWLQIVQHRFSRSPRWIMTGKEEV